MTQRFFSPMVLALFMMLMAGLSTFGAGTASAQFKCDPIKITNTTKCEITGALVSTFGDLEVPYTVGPGQTITVSIGVPIQSVEVKDACGAVWGLQQSGCFNNIQAPGGCCFDFCLDVQGCTVTLKAVAGPCPCK